MEYDFKIITKAFGVLPYEEFMIKGEPGTFQFRKDGLYVSSDEPQNSSEEFVRHEFPMEIINKLFSKDYTIIEKHFRPSKNQQFYTYNEDWSVGCFKLNKYNLEFFIRLSIGMIFRTKEEAIRKRSFYFNLITGDQIENFKENNQHYSKDWNPNPSKELEKIIIELSKGITAYEIINNYNKQKYEPSFKEFKLRETPETEEAERIANLTKRRSPYLKALRESVIEQIKADEKAANEINTNEADEESENEINDNEETENNKHDDTPTNKTDENPTDDLFDIPDKKIEE